MTTSKYSWNTSTTGKPTTITPRITNKTNWWTTTTKSNYQTTSTTRKPTKNGIKTTLPSTSQKPKILVESKSTIKPKATSIFDIYLKNYKT